jgi:murein DD-endopeptidase MepM/ murein hydrolase activator NlpD
VNNKTYFVGYCHLKDEPTLKVDQKIKCGDTIGLVGNTGSASSGPHLHATLSTSPKGVFAGTVLDLYIFLSDLIKKAPQAKPAGQISETKPKKAAKSKICPTCNQEVK